MCRNSGRLGQRPRPASCRKPFRRGIAALGWLTALIGVAVLLAWSVSEVPWGLVAYGRSLPTSGQLCRCHLRRRRHERLGRRVGDGVRRPVLPRQRQGGSLDRAARHAAPADAGTPARAAATQSRVGARRGMRSGRHRRLIRVVPRRRENRHLRNRAVGAVARGILLQGAEHGVLEDPRVQVVYDDARHYILTTPDKFDIITSDPIHPWVKGSATLYTKEYFDLCQAAFEPGRIDHPVGASLRKPRGRGQERDCNLLRCLSAGNNLGEQRRGTGV